MRKITFFKFDQLPKTVKYDAYGNRLATWMIYVNITKTNILLRRLMCQIKSIICFAINLARRARNGRKHSLSDSKTKSSPKIQISNTLVQWLPRPISQLSNNVNSHTCNSSYSIFYVSLLFFMKTWRLSSLIWIQVDSKQMDTNDRKRVY